MSRAAPLGAVVLSAAVRARLHPGRGGSYEPRPAKSLDVAATYSALAKKVERFQIESYRCGLTEADELRPLQQQVVDALESPPRSLVRDARLQGAIYCVLNQCSIGAESSSQLIPLWAQEAGLTFALEALTEGDHLDIRIDSTVNLYRTSLCAARTAIYRSWDGWNALRCLLRTASEEDYRAVVASAARMRGRSAHVRRSICYACPEPEWVAEELANHDDAWLLACVHNPEQAIRLASFRPFHPGIRRVDYLPDLLDRLGEGCVPTVIQYLDLGLRGWGSKLSKAYLRDCRAWVRVCAEVLACVRTLESVEGLGRALEAVPTVALPALRRWAREDDAVGRRSRELLPA